MRRVLRDLGLVSLPLAVWTAASFVLPAYLVPPPLEVAKLFLQSWRVLAIDTLITLVESLSGLLLAISVSFLAAVLFRFFPTLEKLGMPYAISIKSVPIVAIAPLLVLWFGNGLIGKIILAALICFFPILIGLTDGFKSLPLELRYLAEVWSKWRGRTFWLIEFPYAIPYLFSALKVAAPLATVGAVVAEFSGADRGLGHAVLIAAYRADTRLLFAGIICIALLGLVFFWSVAALEKRCLQEMRMSRVVGAV